MGRPLRMFFPGYAYHNVARGNERRNIFRDDDDMRKFLSIMGDAKDKFQFILYSYTLMSNHYHFLAELKLPNMSQAMQYINTAYCIYFNRRYRRSGHLLQGRFGATLVEHGQDIKFVTAYIHLNPARAFMVKKLTDYQWSSHRQFTGGVSNGIAEPEYVLRYFSNNRKEAIEKYEKYLEEVALFDDKKNKARIYGDYVLGSEGFVRKIKLMFKDQVLPNDIANRKKLKKIYGLSDIISSVQRRLKISEETLLFKKGKWNRGKRILIYLLATDAGMTFSGIGKLLGNMSVGSIGRIHKKVSVEIKTKKANKEIVEIRRIYADSEVV